MRAALANFQTLPLEDAARQLLAKLGYKSDKFTKHIRNIFEVDELAEQAVCANYARTASDGKNLPDRLLQP